MSEAKLTLPGRVQDVLDTLLSALKDHAKDDLIAVIAHGSAARGEYREGSSDVDLVVVLSDDGTALLEAIGQPLLLARNAARIEAMILKDSEIAPSADVFPLLYDDIATEGVTLLGASPFSKLEVQDKHRRLRIEQELREAKIRLRVAIGDAAAGLLRFEGVLDRKLKQIRSPLRALLVRAGKPPAKHGVRDVIAAAGELLAVDVAALARAKEDPKAALPALLALLDAAIARADQEEVGA